MRAEPFVEAKKTSGIYKSTYCPDKGCQRAGKQVYGPIFRCPNRKCRILLYCHNDAYKALKVETGIRIIKEDD